MPKCIIKPEHQDIMYEFISEDGIFKIDHEKIPYFEIKPNVKWGYEVYIVENTNGKFQSKEGQLVKWTWEPRKIIGNGCILEYYRDDSYVERETWETSQHTCFLTFRFEINFEI